MTSAKFSKRIFSAITAFTISVGAAGAVDLELEARRTTDRTNAFRAERGLPPLKDTPELTRAARGYAATLAASDEFSHSADGRTPRLRAQMAGYDACLILENLSYHLDSRGFADGALARDAVEGWKRSRRHLENLVDPDVTETGVGWAKRDGEERYFSVQLLALPRSAETLVEIRNETDSTLVLSVHGGTQRVRPQQAISLGVCGPAEIVFVRLGRTRLNQAVRASRGAVYVISGDGSPRVRETTSE